MGVDLKHWIRAGLDPGACRSDRIERGRGADEEAVDRQPSRMAPHSPDRAGREDRCRWRPLGQVRVCTGAEALLVALVALAILA